MRGKSLLIDFASYLLLTWACELQAECLTQALAVNHCAVSDLHCQCSGGKPLKGISACVVANCTLSDAIGRLRFFLSLGQLSVSRVNQYYSVFSCHGGKVQSPSQQSPCLHAGSCGWEHRSCVRDDWTSRDSEGLHSAAVLVG